MMFRLSPLLLVVLSATKTPGSVVAAFSPSRSAFGPSASASAASSSATALRALKSSFGLSTIPSTDDAASEAVAAALSGIGGGIIDGTSNDYDGSAVAFVSTTVSRNVDEVRSLVSAALPGVPIHGLTSSGALLTGSGTRGSGIGVLLLKDDERTGCFATSYDPDGNGEKAASNLREKMENPAAIFISATPGAEEGIIEALREKFPGVPVYGGTAADDELSGAWSVFDSQTSSSTGVSLVGISSSVKIGASMLGPYTPTETTIIATKTEGRRVFEIDGKPAADWVYDWLGDDVRDQYEGGGLILPQTAQKPVGIKKSSGEYVTNHLAALGGEEKFVDFFAPIPEGAELVIMDSGDGPSTGYADAFERAYETARAQGSLGGEEPKAGILVFCGGMAIAVGDNLDDGLTGGWAGKVGDMPVLGMTCFGEQTYLEGEKENVQRNLSVGMVLLG